MQILAPGESDRGATSFCTGHLDPSALHTNGKQTTYTFVIATVFELSSCNLVFYFATNYLYHYAPIVMGFY